MDLATVVGGYVGIGVVSSVAHDYLQQFAAVVARGTALALYSWAIAASACGRLAGAVHVPTRN